MLTFHFSGMHAILEHCATVPFRVNVPGMLGALEESVEQSRVNKVGSIGTFGRVGEGEVLDRW